jgi:hypothetical protein
MDMVCNAPYAFVMSSTGPENCWICKQALVLDDTRLDEYGFRVHERCFQRMIAEKKRPPSERKSEADDTGSENS